MSVSPLKLQPGDSPFHAEPGRSWTMPARFYHDPAIYEREKDAIFYRSWWFAGHVSQLANPGDYITTRIHEQHVVIVRDRGGEVRAFYNVCQHRGHELVQGSGSMRLFVCPYHAWSYELDGRLRRAPNTDDLPDFDRCAFSLKPVRVEVFCGFVFVNLDPDAVAFGEQAAGLEQEIRTYAPEVDRMVFAKRLTYDIASNWKILADNFLECYHCRVTHKDFVNLVEMDSYRSVSHGIYSSHIAAGARSNNTAFRFDKGRLDFGFASWYVWPNLAIIVLPGEPNVAALNLLPAGPERTIEHLDWFLPDPEPSAQIQDAIRYLDEVLQPEDISLCESVQRGVRSRGYNQGRFVVDRDLSELSEHAVHHFQKLVMESLGAVNATT